MKKLLFLILALIATPAFAKPSVSAADAPCQVGFHCGFVLTKTGAATSYSDVLATWSGPAVASGSITIRFQKADTSKTVWVQGLTPGQFTLTIKGMRYALIGRGTAVGTVLGTAPVPAPTPTPTPVPTPVPPLAGWLPSPSLAGAIAATAPDFVLSAAITGGNPIPPSAAPDNVGAFRFICKPGQVLADDPIVYPGQPGKSHLHQFYGNNSADASLTYESGRAKGTSGCQNGVASPANRSSYWMPAMLNGNGNVVPPDWVQIYYKRRPITDPKCNKAPGTWVGPMSYDYAEGFCLPLPNSLRFIFGYDMLTGKTPTGALWFNCDGPTAKPGRYNDLPTALANCPLGQGNRIGAIIEAPKCWDGKNLDSPNHRDHVAYEVYDYGNTGQPWCPATHPYVIPEFLLGAWYQAVAGMHLSCDAMMPAGTPAGVCFHADYWEGWDPTVKAMWTGNCIDKMLNCSAGDLGNGDRLNGAAI